MGSEKQSGQDSLDKVMSGDTLQPVEIKDGIYPEITTKHFDVEKELDQTLKSFGIDIMDPKLMSLQEIYDGQRSMSWKLSKRQEAKLRKSTSLSGLRSALRNLSLGFQSAENPDDGTRISRQRSLIAGKESWRKVKRRVQSQLEGLFTIKG